MATTPARTLKKFTSTDKERQLTEALMLVRPRDRYRTWRLKSITSAWRKDRYFVPISVKIPGSELVLAKKGGAEKTVDRFHRPGEGFQDRQGVQNVRDIADIKLNGQTAAELSKRPIAYDTGFVLPPGTYTLKILARENETGKMGTFERTFTVPDLTTQQTVLPISSVILSSQRTALSEAVFNAEKDKKLLTMNPLFQDGKKTGPQRHARIQNESGDVRLPGSLRACGDVNAAAGGERSVLSRQGEGVPNRSAGSHARG